MPVLLRQLPAPCSSALTAVPTAMNSARSVPNSLNSISSRTPTMPSAPSTSASASIRVIASSRAWYIALDRVLELLVLAPPAELEADVVDARAASTRPSGRKPASRTSRNSLTDRSEVNSVVALAGLHLGQPAQRVLGDAQLVALDGHAAPGVSPAAAAGRSGSGSARCAPGRTGPAWCPRRWTRRRGRGGPRSAPAPRCAAPMCETIAPSAPARAAWRGELARGRRRARAATSSV